MADACAGCLGDLPAPLACSGAYCWAVWALWAEDSPCSSSHWSSLKLGAGACNQAAPLTLHNKASPPSQLQCISHSQHRGTQTGLCLCQHPSRSFNTAYQFITGMMPATQLG